MGATWLGLRSPLAQLAGRVSSAVAQAPADRACALAIFVLLLTLYQLTMAGRLVSGDGEAMYQTTRALLTRRQLSIAPRPEAALGRNGRYYGKYGLAQSAVQAPFFVAGTLVGRLSGTSGDRPARFAVGMTNGVITAALAVVFWLVLREITVPRGAATVAALILGVATPMWPYARADFSEPLQALSLLVALLAVIRLQRTGAPGWAAVLGAAAGTALLTKAASLVLLPPFAVAAAGVLWQRARTHNNGRRYWPFQSLGEVLRPLLAAAMPFCLCALLQASLNYYRFGSVAEFGYGDEPATGFTTPVLTGIGYLLVSPGKGLLLFAPPVILGLARLIPLIRTRSLVGLLAASVFLIELLYYARWWAWHGDWCWGPRYLVITLPFIMVSWGPMLGRWRQTPLLVRGLAVALAAAGFMISFLGVAIDYGTYYSVASAQIGRGVDVRHIRLVPQFSPILGHAWLLQANLAELAMPAGSTRSAENAGSAMPAETGENAGRTRSVDSAGSGAPVATDSALPAPEPAARADGPGGLSTSGGHTPVLWRHPWAGAFPELRPEAPERALGFDFWFTRLARPSPFARYWANLVAVWLLVALIPLTRRLWQAARVYSDRPGQDTVAHMAPGQASPPAWQP